MQCNVEFVPLYCSQGYDGGILIRPPRNLSLPIVKRPGTHIRGG
jgi:hypothetical protein